MQEWKKQVQWIINQIDENIQKKQEQSISLHAIATKLGYSDFHTTRKFKAISGMSFREYVRLRKLAFAVKDIRDSEDNLLDIAVRYGFSSHEAFSRAFKKAYGITPSAYRAQPMPLVLRTKITAFDRYACGLKELGNHKSTQAIKTYFVKIPAHTFLFIKNDKSNGYWDFWQKQNQIPGQDCETICGLLDSIKGKLDDQGGTEPNSGSGQIMAYLFHPQGRLCDWGILRSECHGVRLPQNYKGIIPPQFLLKEVPEADYLVFEHGPFDYEQENRSVEEKIEKAMAEYSFHNSGFCYDTSPGRLFYFYHEPKRFWKYIRPVKKNAIEE